jgi:RNA polymerase sigma-70 factor, ECF subfamily
MRVTRPGCRCASAGGATTPTWSPPRSKTASRPCGATRTRWRGDGEISAWLWGIALRRLISGLRSRRVVELVARRHDEIEQNAEERVLEAVEYGDLGVALQRLTPELRAVIQATVLDGLTSREAAVLLGIPANTVKTPAPE